MVAKKIKNQLRTHGKPPGDQDQLTDPGKQPGDQDRPIDLGKLPGDLDQLTDPGKRPGDQDQLTDQHGVQKSTQQGGGERNKWLNPLHKLKGLCQHGQGVFMDVM